MRMQLKERKDEGLRSKKDKIRFKYKIRMKEASAEKEKEKQREEEEEKRKERKKEKEKKKEKRKLWSAHQEARINKRARCTAGETREWLVSSSPSSFSSSLLI